VFRPQLGDFDGDGRVDLASGSNCCSYDLVHLFLKQKDGSFAPRRDVRLKRPDISGEGLWRAVTSPHLLDWDGDGHTDLVVGYVDVAPYDWEWTLYIGAGPLAGKTEIAVKPFPLPKVQDAQPVYFGFADWDGDGRLDLLAAVRYQKGIDAVRRHAQTGTDEPVGYAVYWFRNTAAEGEPTYAAPSPLLTIPAPWELNGFTVVKGGEGGRLDIVVSVSKNFRPNPKDGYFSVDSQLWLYRRKP
jgi:hypothetical protein